MSSVKQPQAKFIASLFSVLMVFQGKANFRNLSRYCVMHEKRFSRWYRKAFDFVAFNRALLLLHSPFSQQLIQPHLSALVFLPSALRSGSVSNTDNQGERLGDLGQYRQDAFIENAPTRAR